MPFLSVRGSRLYFEERGTGPHLLVAHGLFGSVASSFEYGLDTADIAARGFHVVQYDARGHGRSELAVRASDYSWDALADEMLGVLDAVGLERTSILGTSMGAGAALLLAACLPGRVERLILRTPPAMGADLPRVKTRLGALRFSYRLLGPSCTPAVLALLGQTRMARLLRAQQPGLLLPAIDGLVLGPSEVPEQCVDAIHCPALILTHPGDPEHPLRSGDVLRRNPLATLRVAPASGYWRSHREELSTLVVSFLRSDPVPLLSP